MRSFDAEPDWGLERQLITLIDLSIVNGNGDGDCEEGGGRHTGSAEVDRMGALTGAEGVVAGAFV